MTEETIQAARRAWANDPEAAAQALLGCSAEELFITALRGCNQHKHKPGCPDADGGGQGNTSKKSSNPPLKLKGEEQSVFIKIDRDGNYEQISDDQYFLTEGEDGALEKNRAGEYYTQGRRDTPAKTPKEALAMAGVNLSDEAIKNITEYMKGKHERFNFRRNWYEKDEEPQIMFILTK